MFNNLSKNFFLFMLIFSTLIVISANSWFSMWIGLEINLLSFIPLMIKTNNLMSSEAAIKYFIVQAFTSSIMLFFIISYMLINNFTFQLFMFNLNSMIISLTLMLKMGIAPLHFWLPNVMEGINWNNNLILMTWQKIAPMMILSYFYFYDLFFIFIVFSIFLGSIGGLNQISMRKIMAFSSINNSGWMLSALMFNEMLWSIYFILYFFLTFSMVFFLNYLKIFYLNQLYSLIMISSYLKFFFSMNLLSLGGLPPFLGFLPKWMIIQALLSVNQNFLIIFMVLMTLITLYFYLRISFSSFLLNYDMMNWKIFLIKKNFFLQINIVFSFISIFSFFLLIKIMFFIL